MLSTNFQDMDDFFDDLEFTYREATWMVCVESFLYTWIIPEGGMCVANGGKEEIVLRFTFAHDR